MKERHSQSIDWKKLKDPVPEELMNKLEMTSEQFLQTPNARGIIMKGTVQKLKSSKMTSK